jgi:hypothetical protein
MKRVNGDIGISALECANSKINKYIVRWDFKPTYDKEGNQSGVNYCEKWINYKPTL